MVNVPIKMLRKLYPERLDEIIATGQVDGEYVWFQPDVYSALLKKRFTRELTTASKISNAIGAAGRVVTAILGSRGVMVSYDEQSCRMAICATCEFYTGTTCRKCGCHIRFKAKLQTEHCPIGKW